MSEETQSFQHWPDPLSIAVDNVANEQSIQIQDDNSGQENTLGSFLTGPDELSGTSHTFVQPSIPDATRSWGAEERNMALGHDDLLSQDLTDLYLQRQSSFQFWENGSLQAGNAPWSFINPPNGAASLPASGPTTERSPKSPVGPSATGDLSSQVLTGIDPQRLFSFPVDGNGHSQAGNVLSPLPIPSTGTTGPPTPLPITSLTAQSTVEPSAAGPAVIKLGAVEDEIRAVGSRRTQQASDKRRKKEAKYLCPFRNTGCDRTFTARHNVKYHQNSHLGLTPYECTASECSYAAASPATLKRHTEKRHSEDVKVQVIS